uniref:Protein Flattop n=1 Tax=Sphenodon punctatus TaxID=8508 RepID=A0A8D0GKR7_SPHPU
PFPPALSLQYEDAFVARNLQNWTLPKLCKQHPSAREGYTQFVANERGHLLPLVPRSKVTSLSLPLFPFLHPPPWSLRS